MVIYHGSEKIVEKPLYGFGNSHNDYGLGFYCSQSLELAKEWACQKNADGFANSYELDIEKLSVLDLSQEKFSILHWISILMQNRVFSPKSPLGKQNLDFLIRAEGTYPGALRRKGGCARLQYLGRKNDTPTALRRGSFIPTPLRLRRLPTKAEEFAGQDSRKTKSQTAWRRPSKTSPSPKRPPRLLPNKRPQISKQRL